jgi:hypothetical protein
VVDSGLLFRRQQKPFLLVLEGESSAGGPSGSVAQILQQADFRFAIAHSVREAREIISDLHFIGGSADGLLADYSLPDGLSTGVLHDFRRSFPNKPIGVLADSRDVGAYLWSSLPRVEVLSRARMADELQRWLADWRASA